MQSLSNFGQLLPNVAITQGGDVLKRKKEERQTKKNAMRVIQVYVCGWVSLIVSVYLLCSLNTKRLTLNRTLD